MVYTNIQHRKLIIIITITFRKQTPPDSIMSSPLNLSNPDRPVHVGVILMGG